MGIKYYKYDQASGEKYFRVIEDNPDVLQIIQKTNPKRGRAYSKGVTFIKYVTFISSYGLSNKYKLDEITENHFNSILDAMIFEFKLK